MGLARSEVKRQVGASQRKLQGDRPCQKAPRHRSCRALDRQPPLDQSTARPGPGPAPVHRPRAWTSPEVWVLGIKHGYALARMGRPSMGTLARPLRLSMGIL